MFTKEVLGVSDIDRKLAWITGAELPTATGANRWRLEGTEEGSGVHVHGARDGGASAEQAFE